MKLVFDMEIVFPEDFFCTHQRCDAGRISFPLHSHDFFEFFWIDQGEAVHFLNSREYHLPERTLHLIRPGDTHYLKASGTFGQLAFFNINVRSNLFMTLFHLIGGGRLSPDDMGTSFLLSEKAFQEFSQRAERLLKLQDHYDLYAARVEGTSLIFEIMATFLRHFSPDVNLEPAWLKELLQKMRLPENFSRGVECLFQLAGRSREHVCRSMRKYYGTSPREYVLNLKLQNAAQKLLDTDLPVAEIAFSCGFNNLAYFHTVFSRRFHCSPGRYRRNFLLAHEGSRKTETSLGNGEQSNHRD